MVWWWIVNNTQCRVWTWHATLHEMDCVQLVHAVT